MIKIETPMAKPTSKNNTTPRFGIGEWYGYSFTILDEQKRHEIKPILITEPIPSDTMSTSKKFHNAQPVIVDKVVSAVKALSDNEETLKIMKELYNIDAMVDATSEDYEPVREAARLLDIDVEGPEKKAEKAEPEDDEEKVNEVVDDEENDSKVVENS